MDEKAFDAMFVKGTGLFTRSIVRTSPAAKLCEEVYQRLQQGNADLDDYAKKIEQLKEVRDQVPEKGRSFVGGLIDQLATVLAFEEGEWVDVKFDKELTQWGEVGKWTVEPSTNSVLFSGPTCQRLSHVQEATI